MCLLAPAPKALVPWCIQAPLQPSFPPLAAPLRLPYVLVNTGKKVFGAGPRLTPDEEAEWRQQAASVREAATAEAAAAREQKRQEKAAKREAKQQEKAAKATAKAAAKAEARERKAAAKAARKQQL